MSIGSNGMVQGRHAWLWCTNRTKESSLLRGKSGMVQLLSSFMPKIGFFLTYYSENIEDYFVFHEYIQFCMNMYLFLIVAHL